MTKKITQQDKVRVITPEGKSKILASFEELREEGLVGVTKHTELIDKEIAGIIDHADRSIPPTKFTIPEVVGETRHATIGAGATVRQTFPAPTGEVWLVQAGGFVGTPATGSRTRIGLTDGTLFIPITERTGAYTSNALYVNNLISTPTIYPYVETYNADTVDHLMRAFVSGHRITKGYAIVNSETIGAGLAVRVYFVPDVDETVIIYHALTRMNTGAETHEHAHFVSDTIEAVMDGIYDVSGLYTLETRNYVISDDIRLGLYLKNLGTTAYTGYFLACGELMEG